mmetsp:Transcript_129637/g.415753  ORF Transcript_129637/g.415753 Transcript_129637/m.415753 type:complete len:221 (-) Transcript_129637:396-1058(-)
MPGHTSSIRQMSSQTNNVKITDGTCPSALRLLGALNRPHALAPSPSASARSSLALASCTCSTVSFQPSDVGKRGRYRDITILFRTSRPVGRSMDRRRGGSKGAVRRRVRNRWGGGARPSVESKLLVEGDCAQFQSRSANGSMANSAATPGLTGGELRPHALYSVKDPSPVDSPTESVASGSSVAASSFAASSTIVCSAVAEPFRGRDGTALMFSKLKITK